MKLGLLAAGLVLVAGGAVGCGDDGGDGGDGGGGGNADESASAEAFCAAFQAFSDDLSAVTGTEENLGEILKKAAEGIEDVGTPEDIPDDAKEGLQLILDAILALPDDASVEDMAGLEDSFSDADKEKTDAFSDYLEKTCPELGDGASEEPTDDASEDASDDATDDSDGGS